MSSRFFKNEPNQKKFEAIWEKKGQKARAGIFGPDKLENHTSRKEKEGERARSEDLKRNQQKRIKQWVAL